MIYYNTFIIVALAIMFIGCGSQSTERVPLDSVPAPSPTIVFMTKFSKSDFIAGNPRELLPNPMNGGNVLLANPNAVFDGTTGVHKLHMEIANRLFSIMNQSLMMEYIERTVVVVTDINSGKIIKSSVKWLLRNVDEDWPFRLDIAVCDIEIQTPNAATGRYKIEFTFPYNELNEEEKTFAVVDIRPAKKSVSYMFSPNLVVSKWGGGNDYDRTLNVMGFAKSDAIVRLNVLCDEYDLVEKDGYMFPSVNGSPMKFLLYQPTTKDSQNVFILCMSPDGKFINRVPFIHNMDVIGLRYSYK